MTCVVTVTSNFIPSADDSYGAPIAVGRSCFELFFPRCAATVSWPLFAVDCAINWILWLAIARVTGIAGTIAGMLGALMSVVLIPTMISFSLPIVGLPIPFARTPMPNAYVIWLDAVAWAAGGAGLVQVVRSRRVRSSAKP